MKHELTKGSVPRLVVSFALPYMAASLIQALYSAVDLYVVGQFNGSSAVSAVSIGGQVMQTVTGIVTGIAAGGTVLLGNRIGARDDEGAGRAVGNLAALFVGIALLLMPVMLLLNREIITLMQTPAEAEAEARAYLFYCACGIPFIAGYNGVSALFRGTGDSRTPVLFVLIACICNVAGDFFLVGYLGMGAAGAAIATSASQAVSFFSSLLYLRKKGFAFPVHRRHFRPRRGVISRILQTGLPIALQDALVNLSFLIITAIVNTLGLTASAAVGVAERLLGFAFLVPGGFAAAVAAIASQNLGAGKPQRARQSLWYGVIFAMSVGAVICLLCNVMPERLTGIFSRDEAVIRAAGEYIHFYSLDCIFTGFIFCVNSYFSAGERSIIAFGHSMASTFLVRIPGTWLLSRFCQTSLTPMGLAAPMASVLSILICSVVLLTDRKKRRKSRSVPV